MPTITLFASEKDGAPVPDGARMERWVDADAVRLEWLRDAMQRRPELERTLREQQEAVDILRTQMAQESDEADWKRWAPTRRLVVRLDATEAVALRVRYRVLGATWSPAYALHIDSSYQSGRLVLRAVVGQATGEDWSGVQLRLSTAPLMRQVDAPELKSRRLGRAGQQPPSAWRSLPDDIDSLFPSELEPGAVPMERAGSERVEALGAPWNDDNVAALDTQVPTRKRKARLAPPTPPPAMERAERSGPPAAPARLAMSAPMDEALALAVQQSGGAPAASAPGGGTPAKTSIVPQALDYGSLRMVPWDGEIAHRGRLRRRSVGDDLREQGVDDENIARIERARWTLNRLAGALSQQPLPRHHVAIPLSRGPDYRFDMAGRADVPSDGAWHAVSLEAHALDLDVRYRAIPRNDPRVFRTLSATMGERLPLLPGPVDVYVAGHLELTTPWKGSGQDSPIELGLGPEDGLRVARNVRYREEATGLFSGGRRVHTEVDVAIASSLGREVSVELLDRMPVAEDDSVVVQLESAEPIAAPWAGDPDGTRLAGGLRQSLRIPPGGEAKATLHWHMSVGSKFEIEGGERRGH